jgi:3-oxoacyl-[acyl-carrier protein] reductase
MIDTGLNSQVILITGANNPLGIGAATAQAFARQGARLCISYLRLSPKAYGISVEEAIHARAPGMPLYHGLRMSSADKVVASIRAAGGQAVAYEADLTDPAQIEQIYDWAEATFGPVDVLVNNAAHYEEPDTIFTTTAASIDRTFAVNVRGSVLMIAEYVRRYQQRGGRSGRIINLSTDAAQIFPSQISYGASKATLEAFTRSLAHEIGPLGITINTVAPGPVQSGYIPEPLATQLTQEIPLGRIGQPDDIADAILFLASHQARWITGQVLKVSGGHAL